MMLGFSVAIADIASTTKANSEAARGFMYSIIDYETLFLCPGSQELRLA